MVHAPLVPTGATHTGATPSNGPALGEPPSATPGPLIEPFLPIGDHGPYPERLREQFEGGDLTVPHSSQWRRAPGRFGPWPTVYGSRDWRPSGGHHASACPGSGGCARWRQLGCYGVGYSIPHLRLRGRGPAEFGSEFSQRGHPDTGQGAGREGCVNLTALSHIRW